ncbi:MAG: saccharopine dehydrogenase C-terminal domain-containing protein [Gemmatimonadota bacterium]
MSANGLPTNRTHRVYRTHRSSPLVALRVEVEGKKAGKPKKISFDLLDYFDGKNQVSAMERTTGYSLSITGQLQAERRVNRMGVTTPEQAIRVRGTRKPKQ